MEAHEIPSLRVHAWIHNAYDWGKGYFIINDWIIMNCRVGLFHIYFYPSA